MKKSIFILSFATVLFFSSIGRTQVTVPPDIKDKILTMPEKAAEKNREGQVFKPYFASHWYKGNTHCHSDTDGERMPRHGDGPPENTLNWYADHNYDFIVFTDHNYWHEGLEAPKGLLYIKGEEITTMRYHVTAMGIKSYIRPAFGEEKITAYQDAVDKTLEQGGLPIINHPVTPLGFCMPEDFKKLKNVRHFEVYNIQPGNYQQLSEPLWDNLLTDGYIYYGVVSDDAHKFVRKNPLIGDPPGGGWIMVNAADLSQKHIMEAMQEGKFYGSSGVLVKQYKVTKDSVQIWLDSDVPCDIEFISDFGKIVHAENGNYASYKIKGDELYVRVRATDPDGKFALMQPVFFR